MISPSNNNTQINFKRKINLNDEIFVVFHEITLLSFEIFSDDSYKIFEINFIYLFIFENFLIYYLVLYYFGVVARRKLIAHLILVFNFSKYKHLYFKNRKPQNSMQLNGTMFIVWKLARN